MDFQELFTRLNPRLKAMAARYSHYSPLLGRDDLYQEACITLWNSYKEGIPPETTESYLIRGCEFRLLNYIRVNREKAHMVNLEEPINDEGDTLKDIISDNIEEFERKIEGDLVFDKIRNNGFSKKEKDVLSLLLKGYTVREAAQKLGISHVMVVKHKKKIITKWHKKGYQN